MWGPLVGSPALATDKVGREKIFTYCEIRHFFSTSNVFPIPYVFHSVFFALTKITYSALFEMSNQLLLKRRRRRRKN